jgi:ferredoxin/coenzyme F420-reducing hydrogenase delta subunit
VILQTFQKSFKPVFSFLSLALEKGFGTRLNPLQYLGAMTIFFFWIVLVSGIWLFIFFQTSVDGAYESVEYLTHDQWYFGSVMRSLHRYASDAAMVTLALHIIKEFVFDHHRGKRWFSWITGIPLLWIVFPLGITGYWLVWDELALYVALTSAELLDWLPIFTDSMARNFLSTESLSDRFFTLMAFLHLIGLPLFLVFAIWLHVLRISRPKINPPRELMVGTLLIMLVLSLVYPALSQEKANLATAPQNLSLDWYYLFVYPLMKSWSPGAVWLLLIGSSLLLFIAPWLPPAKARAVAVVDLDNCNGCQRCVDDCPYSAVMMQPRSDGKSYEMEAIVDESMCVACGICVGACPTATPFRKASALSPGIDLPDLSASMLRAEVENAGASLQGSQRLMVFTCQGGQSLGNLSAADTALISVRCMAQLPPSFFDFILSKNHADGVFLAGCTGGACQYRQGSQWTGDRLERTRDPHLRKRINSRRIARGWDDGWKRFGQPVQALKAFREQLSALDSTEAFGVGKAYGRKVWQKRFPLRAMAYGLFALVASIFSAWPAIELLATDEAVVSLTFSHAGQRIEECRRLTQAEMNKLAPNMRKTTECERERHPLQVVFMADGETLYQESLKPSGIWSDGESTVYARFPLKQGSRKLYISMNDSGGGSEIDYELETTLDLERGQHVVVEFDHELQTFQFR